MNRWLGFVVALVVAGACADDFAATAETDAGTAASDSSGSTTNDDWTPPASSDAADDANVVAECGDGIISIGEQCDGDNVGGKTCATFGWEASPGGLRCNDDCQLDLTSCVFCGNDAVDQATEECDGDSVLDEACGDFEGFFDGTLRCTDQCKYDFGGCFSSCGNGVIDPGEDCEFQFVTCEEAFGEGWQGEILCVECQYGPMNCSLCGNGIAEGFEDCDGGTTAPDGFEYTCDVFFGPGTPGDVSCTEFCQVDTSGCDTCGNGNAEPDELCDGFDLEGFDCEDLGYYGGLLQCTENCQGFDTSLCNDCGDGILTPESEEECDGKDLNGATCQTLGFADGSLSCNNACEYNLADCGTCGDGIKVDDEECDGDDLGGLTCQDFNAAAQGGELGCDEFCLLDGSACEYIEPGDVVISEILYWAAATPDTPLGQWIEFHNPSPTDTLQLMTCFVQSNLFFENFVIGTSFEIAPGGYATLATGGIDELFFEPTGQLSENYSLSNTGDVVRLVCNGQVTDEVIFDAEAPWPATTPGTSIALDPAALDAAANDDGANWCASSSGIGIDTFGTPGAENDC